MLGSDPFLHGVVFISKAHPRVGTEPVQHFAAASTLSRARLKYSGALCFPNAEQAYA